MTDAPRLTRLLVEAMAKHLPPSASALQLVDISGRTGAAMRSLRPDCVPQPVELAALDSLTSDAADAAAGIGSLPDSDALAHLLRSLRPGGRLIWIDPDDSPNDERLGEIGRLLEAAGYTRILVSAALDEGYTGVLLRGEKAHVTADTHARVQVASGRDTSTGDLSAFRGRFVHLLIRQTPNRRAWSLQPDDVIRWEAVALDVDGTPRVLAFSSLPQAVSFMQPAILSGAIRDVHKVAKFSRETAAAWNFTLWINPPQDALSQHPIALIGIDPQSAITGEE